MFYLKKTEFLEKNFTKKFNTSFSITEIIIRIDISVVIKKE